MDWLMYTTYRRGELWDFIVEAASPCAPHQRGPEGADGGASSKTSALSMATSLRLLERKHVTAIRDTRIDSPGAANNIVKAISALYAWAIEVGEAKVNPCNGIKRLKSGEGWHTWTLDEIEQFEAKHPPGSTARRALAIFMFTGLRLSDAAILGRQHLENGWIRIRPGKTRKSSGVEVNVPILPDLEVELGQVPAGQLTFLVTEYGKPFSDKGLGNKMRQWCDDQVFFIARPTGCVRQAPRSQQRTARQAIS